MAGTSRSGGTRRGGTDHTPVDGLPQRPERLPDDVAAKWNELIEQLPDSSLRRVDVHQLKLLCELLAIADRYSAKLFENPDDHKTGRLLINTAQHIHRLSAAFGLTPFDRRKLNLEVSTRAEDDPIADLLARYQALN